MFFHKREVIHTHFFKFVGWKHYQKCDQYQYESKQGLFRKTVNYFDENLS